MVTASVVVAAGWLVAALAAFRAGRPALVRAALVVAVVSPAAGLWAPLVPAAVAAWFCLGLTLPDGELASRWRRILAAAVLAVAVAWTAWLAVTARELATATAIAVVVPAGLAASAAVALRCRRVDAVRRRTLQWTAAGAVVMVAADAVLLAVHLLLGVPDDVLPWLAGAFVAMPLGLVFGLLPATARVAERALVEAFVVAGLAVMVVAVYLVVVVGLGRAPVGGEREILFGSVVAALSAVVLALPLRVRLVSFGETLLGRAGTPPEEALASFGARMSRAVPFDELLLQLVESLRATVAPAGAEVWVGAGGDLSRTVSVPERPARRLVLTEKERVVVGRTRVGGPAWCAVWLPALLADDDHAQAPEGASVRVAPAAHLGELLGLLVVRRAPDDPDFSAEDERVLVELARQVGLALHNMRLDSALQASLEELRMRNEELQASRLRIVSAADASRRTIERDLHDGAQQHLVALSVKLGLAKELAGEDPAATGLLLDELRTDVQETIGALRELAHGIYPPLLRNHGLDQALQSVARRAPLPCELCVKTTGRYAEEVEAAVYFCCLEAIQNAGKHAGSGASIVVRIEDQGGLLRFEVRDDGAGFAMDAGGTAQGHGFVNMADRLGALGGTLHVESAPGAGTAVRGEVPNAARAAAAA
ncbi:MAG: GAF domain-containing protein [Streptosporangiales bacterium]|nr:GAF domain-containing protein [Streptosporangiales bacterium]